MNLRLLLLSLVLPAFTLLPAQDEEPELDSAAIMGLFTKLFDPGAVEVLPEYRFDHSIHYTSVSVDWLDETKNEEYDLHFTAGGTHIGVRQQDRRSPNGKAADMFVVYDLAAKTLASFMNADTMKVCMRMKMPEAGSDKPGSTFKKSGKTRTIAGLMANEWVAKDEHEETHLWIAESTVGDLGAVFHAFGDLHGKGSIERGDFGNGIVLAGSVKRKDADKPHYEFEATEVRLNTSFIFKNEGYQMM